jgi:3-methyladenine DNA glycosylase AlkD
MARTTASSVAFTRNVEIALTPLIDVDKAVGMRAYMRGRFDYLGIPTPQRRAAVKPLIRSLTPDRPSLRLMAHSLWQMNEREYQYVAADLLSYHASALEVEDLEWLLAIAQEKAWWDSVDALVKVISRVVLAGGAKGRRRMDLALCHENFWMRRIAMIHQLGWRELTDTVRLFRYADKLAHEKEFFIRKAVGWALRDYAWHDWRRVGKYLSARTRHLSPLTVREASKNFAKLAKQDKLLTRQGGSA